MGVHGSAELGIFSPNAIVAIQICPAQPCRRCFLVSVRLFTVARQTTTTDHRHPHPHHHHHHHKRCFPEAARERKREEKKDLAAPDVTRSNGRSHGVCGYGYVCLSTTSTHNTFF